MSIDTETSTTTASKLRLKAKERLAEKTAAKQSHKPGSKSVHEMELHQVDLELRNTELLRIQNLLEYQQLELEQQNGELHRFQEQLEAQQIELELQNDELSRAQVELEISRNRFAELYDFAPVGYFTFDTSGVILEVNRTGADFWERNGRPDRKRFPSFIVPPGQESAFSRPPGRVAKGEEMQKCGVRLAGKDGTARFQLQSVPVAAGESKDRCILCSIVDGTVARELGT